jgi:hypothetical protein
MGIRAIETYTIAHIMNCTNYELVDEQEGERLILTHCDPSGTEAITMYFIGLSVFIMFMLLFKQYLERGIKRD